jgi:hypothetical protein
VYRSAWKELPQFRHFFVELWVSGFERRIDIIDEPLER